MHTTIDTTWHNVHGFTQAPETRHDGHRLIDVGPMRVLDEDEPDALGADVTCACGETFLAFAEEIHPRPAGFTA